MNIALVTITNNKYLKGSIAMIKSFLKHNIFNGEIVIFYSDNNFNKLAFNNIYKKIKFIDISKKRFNQLNFIKKTYCTLSGTYNANNRFEIFKLKYDKILYADSDIIFNGNISSILNLKNKFIAVSTSKQHLASVVRKKYFDAGIMLISKKYLNIEIFNKIKKFSKTKKFRDDEEILNCFFKNKVYYISKKYNTLIHEINSIDLKKYRVIQYVGEVKPWQGCNIQTCFDKYNLEQIINNKNGLIILERLKNLFKTYE